MSRSNTAILIVAFIGLLISFSCKEMEIGNPIEHILDNSNEPAIRGVMDKLSVYEIQIQFSQIDRTNGTVRFRDHTFQMQDSSYFYPASTVKLPIAVLALEKVGETANFKHDTKFYVEGDTVETTIAEEVIKVLAVSDNEANNRMFEFLGQDRINQRLSSLGVGPARFSHRLSTENADDVTTRPLIIYLNDSTTTSLNVSVNREIKPLKMNGILKGKGFMEDEVLIDEAFDFSLKNYYPISSQHELMKRLIFPEVFEEYEIPELGAIERELLLEAMWSPPRFHGYDEEEYYDGYVKFFIYGDTEERMPEHIKIYNKVGYAYGTLTDCAYIVDHSNNVEFLLTATILVNENKIFNDDNYEYESIGIPFLAALGREIHRFETNRK